MTTPYPPTPSFNPQDQNWQSSGPTPPQQAPYQPPHPWAGSAQTLQSPPPRPKKHTGLKVAAIILGGLLLLGIGGVIGVGHRETIVVTTPGPTIITVGPTTTVTATTTTTTATTTAPATAGATTGITDGTYLVGTEIASGTYKSSGGMATDSMCYVETQDKAGNVLDGEIGLGGGSMTFKIPPDAYKFMAKGCGTWTKIG